MLTLTDDTDVCARCGAEKIFAKHTRLYGLMCACGSQEWINPDLMFTRPGKNQVAFEYRKRKAKKGKRK